ncbi:MAG: hypothetical protein P8M03_05410 [Flavobacteriaceae bacterium]|nr:hypothetical protein [Flavobacteriaceae bacterium]
MKKILICIILSVVITTKLNAQRPNTKKLPIPYLQYPSNPINQNIDAYFSNIVNNSAVFQPSNGNLILRGYKKVSSLNKADLEIKFVINNVSFLSKVFKENYKKKVNDSTYVTAVGGRYRVDASINYSEYVTDVKNDKILILNEGILSSASFISNLIKNYREAVQRHEYNKDREAVRLYVQITNQSINKFQTNINDNFGFPMYYYYMPFARGKGRKFDYSDLSKSFNNMKNLIEIAKNAFSGINSKRYGLSESMMEEYNKNINECVHLLEYAIKEYVPRKKRTRIGDKIIDHLHLNISAAYYLKGDLTKAYEALSKVKKSKGEIKKAAKFQSKLKDLENRKNNYNKFLSINTSKNN